VTITADLRTMVRIWRGDLSWSTALGAEQVRIEGPLRRAVPSWFALSPFAVVPALNPRVDNGGTLFSTDELRLP
jgi:hypothetical protein